MKLYEELTWRGLIKDVSNEEKVKEMLNEESIKFYCGFDPTGESLTVGHLVQIVRMMLLEKHGHIPVVLIGGGTGLIGDPRQTSERKLLTVEQSLHNAEMIKKQISYFLNPEKVLFVNNYDWISKIDLIEFLRDYGKHFNINYMLSKENVQARLETGISYTEFSYMILQALDFHHLYVNENVKMQFGGSDQWGNITTGLELIRKLEGADNEAVGLSSPLLLKSDGTKFGKSETGALWLDKDLSSPYEIYQYFLNIDDADVITYLKTLTLLEVKKIEELAYEVKETPELRGAQKRLAYEVTKLMHKEAEADEAVKVSQALFGDGIFEKLSLNNFETLNKTLDSAKLGKASDLLDIIISLQLATSKREAREFVKNGAITINNEKVTLKYQFDEKKSYHGKYFIVQRGKRRFAMAVLANEN